jgi:GNAT superfamily N-acetyltransferase
MPTGDVTDPLEQVLGHLGRTLRSLADETRSVGPGWILRTRSLSHVWALNQLRITAPVEFAEVVALAEQYQGDLPYRHIVSEVQPAPFQLAGPFVAAGWRVDREVLMALSAKPGRDVDSTSVIELSEAQALGLMRRWIIEDFPAITSGLEELEEYARREGRLWSEQCFGILDRDGAAVAVAKLRSDGSTAWVEDVYTAPEARGRGYARTLVTYATGLARSTERDLTFIVADDNDWPKHLYASIGFRPLGTISTFHRDVDPPLTRLA